MRLYNTSSTSETIPVTKQDNKDDKKEDKDEFIMYVYFFVLSFAFVCD